MRPRHSANSGARSLNASVRCHVNVRAQFLLDRAYFRESYTEWLQSFSRFRRWERQFGALLIVAGVLFAKFSIPSFVSALCVTIGIAEILEYYWYRHNWIASRLKAREGENANNSVELVFTEQGVKHAGPTSHGEMSWQAVKKVDLCRGGLFLRIGDRQSIYVPNSSLTPSGTANQIAIWGGHGT